MSNLTIVLVCGAILLFGWLLRKYQDGELPFKPSEKLTPKPKLTPKQGSNLFYQQPKTGSATKLATKPIEKLADIVQQAFPAHIIKDKKDDENCVFVCAVNEHETELAIIKHIHSSKKTVQSMGGVVRVTYGHFPSKKELQKDLQQVI